MERTWKIGFVTYFEVLSRMFLEGERERETKITQNVG
jgi:hypothetical protein